MFKKNVFVFLSAVFGGIFALFLKDVFFAKKFEYQKKSPEHYFQKTFFSSDNLKNTVPEKIDFTTAAEKSLNAIVHVKNTAIHKITNPFDYFFGGGGTRKYKQIGFGSGVIITEDGYIVTNHHVISEATEIEITLNNKKIYKAKLIGTDPDNDIALLKINTGKKLEYLSFADSNQTKIGQWVLAVGNPYNLTSTVTAGIISAKGRDLKGNSNVESFIQTDAAVNSGNSGGALVNTKGQLIGINTAIASKTGAFVGYSFAVPSNIVRKVVEDLMEYGNVQNAFLGIQYSDREHNLAGVFINEVTKGSGAEKGGLKKGDIIIKIGQVKINHIADLKGQLNAKRPKEIVAITVLRGQKKLVKKVMLSAKKDLILNFLGFHLEIMTTKEAKKYDLQKGVKISKITNPELKNYGIKKGFVLLEINGIRVKTLSQVQNILANKRQSRIRLTFLNLKGERETYMYH